MKKRTGFVSNSSSSSFIVKFPRIPSSAKEVKKIVFGDDEFIYSPWGDEKFETSKAAQIIFNDIKAQKKNDIKRAKELASQIHGKDAPKYEDFIIPGTNREDWNAYNKACDEYGERKLEEFFSVKRIRRAKIKKIEGHDVTNEGEIFFIFEFSDNNGAFEAVLEHANIFRRLEHIYINQH